MGEAELIESVRLDASMLEESRMEVSTVFADGPGSELGPESGVMI